MNKRIIFLLLHICFSLSVFSQLNTNKLINAGKNALYYEDYVLAIQYFNQIITVRPDIPESYFYRAVAKISLEDYKGAYDDCSRALDRNPFLSEAYHCRGTALLNLKREEEAKQDFLSTLEFNPENYNALLNLAATEVLLENYDQALEIYSRIIRRRPYSIQTAYRGRGDLYLILADTIKASADFDTMLQYFPYSSASYNVRAHLRIQKKDYDGAIEDCNEALRWSPYSVSAYVNRAIAYYFKKKYQASMDDLDKAIDIDPNNFLAYYNRALLLLEVAENNKAIDDFTMVLRFDASNYPAYYNRALLRYEIADFKGALEDINAVLERYSEFPPAFFLRSEIQTKLGNRKEAEKDAFLANKYEKEGHYKSVKKDSVTEFEFIYRKVILIDPGKEKEKTGYENEIRGRLQNRNIDIELLPNFTITFFRNDAINQKDYFYAPLDEFTKSIASKMNLYLRADDSKLSQQDINMLFVGKNAPAFKNALYNAVRLGLLQDYQEAIINCEKVLRDDPDYLFALFYLVNMKLKELETELAYKQESAVGEDYDTQYVRSLKQLNNYYEKMLEINDGFYFAWYNRGNLLAQVQYYQDAINCYTQAILLNPNLAEAYYNRGLVYIKMGENKRGVSDLSRAGELGLYNAYNVMKRYTY